MNVFGQTDKGPREQNQDFYLTDSFSDRLYLVVADGVGGNKSGEIASKAACEFFMAAIKSGMSPSEAITFSHEGVLNLAAENNDMNGMATTLTCAIIDSGKVQGVHCGDSRLYLLRGNGLKQVTNDHSEVAKLLLSGKITKLEASTYPRKNVLYSAVGTMGEFIYQEFEFLVERGDRVLLMTDGVYSVVSKKELRDLSMVCDDFSSYFYAVLKSVVGGGTKDNYTLLGVQIADGESES